MGDYYNEGQRVSGEWCGLGLKAFKDKYVANRFLTMIQNLLLNFKLSEYHTGYRAFSRQALNSLPLEEDSDDFIFYNEILAHTIYKQYRIGEISCPARYFPEASSIDFARSVKEALVIRLGVKQLPVFCPKLRAKDRIGPSRNDDCEWEQENNEARRGRTEASKFRVNTLQQPMKRNRLSASVSTHAGSASHQLP